MRKILFLATSILFSEKQFSIESLNSHFSNNSVKINVDNDFKNYHYYIVSEIVNSYYQMLQATYISNFFSFVEKCKERKEYNEKFDKNILYNFESYKESILDDSKKTIYEIIEDKEIPSQAAQFLYSGVIDKIIKDVEELNSKSMSSVKNAASKNHMMSFNGFSFTKTSEKIDTSKIKFDILSKLKFSGIKIDKASKFSPNSMELFFCFGDNSDSRIKVMSIKLSEDIISVFENHYIKSGLYGSGYIFYNPSNTDKKKDMIKIVLEKWFSEYTKLNKGNALEGFTLSVSNQLSLSKSPSMNSLALT